jgi:hypothetical protein
MLGRSTVEVPRVGKLSVANQCHGDASQQCSGVLPGTDLTGC